MCTFFYILNRTKFCVIGPILDQSTPIPAEFIPNINDYVLLAQGPFEALPEFGVCVSNDSFFVTYSYSAGATAISTVICCSAHTGTVPYYSSVVPTQVNSLKADGIFPGIFIRLSNKKLISYFFAYTNWQNVYILMYY
jgi:hypothetical protein